MRTAVCCWAMALLLAAGVQAADFGTRGGPEPANIDAISGVLRQDRYDRELLISFSAPPRAARRAIRPWRCESPRFSWWLFG